MRKFYFKYFTVLLFASLAFSCQEKEKKRPNILFIMSDDHAYQAISAYDSTLLETPNIDRIANEGMLFTNACVTNSICAPSRAVILTGKHSHINGKIDNNFPFDTTNITFPQLLQNAGYQTAMFGKLHFGNNPKGFDEFKILPGQGEYYNPDFITKKEGKINYIGYVTDIITEMTLGWLKTERTEEKPFFLAYLHKAPHRQWQPAQRHYETFTKRKFREPATLFDDYSNRPSAAAEAAMNIQEHMYISRDLKMYPETIKKLGIKTAFDGDTAASRFNLNSFTPEQRKAWEASYDAVNEDYLEKYPTMTKREEMSWRYNRYMQDYLGCIAAVDEGVGQVLDYLEESGLAENTIVIYTSDQGFYLGEHGWFDKRFAYNESFKTPLLVKWPSVIKAGTRNSQMVQNLDFAQTILEAAGITAPSDMQGESLVRLFKGDTKNFRDAVYYHYYEYPGYHMAKRHKAVITEDFKLIHYYYDIDAWELIDRKKDPLEMTNKYNNPAYAETVKQLKFKLEELRVKYKDSDALDAKYLEIYKQKGLIPYTGERF